MVAEVVGTTRQKSSQATFAMNKICFFLDSIMSFLLAQSGPVSRGQRFYVLKKGSLWLSRFTQLRVSNWL